jgi:hypothetical protein
MLFVNPKSISRLPVNDTSGVAQTYISRTDVSRIFAVGVDKNRIVYYAYRANFTDVNSTEAKTILLARVKTDGSSEIGKKMQAFKGAFYTKTGDFENFQVICVPPGGGAFSWNFNPQAQAGIASAVSTKMIGNTATFVAEKSGTYGVTATYTAPDGSRCEVTQRVVVQ